MYIANKQHYLFHLFPHYKFHHCVLAVYHECHKKTECEWSGTRVFPISVQALDVKHEVMDCKLRTEVVTDKHMEGSVIMERVMAKGMLQYAPVPANLGVKRYSCTLACGTCFKTKNYVDLTKSS